MFLISKLEHSTYVLTCQVSRSAQQPQNILTGLCLPMLPGCPCPACGACPHTSFSLFSNKAQGTAQWPSAVLFRQGWCNLVRRCDIDILHSSSRHCPDTSQGQTFMRFLHDPLWARIKKENDEIKLEKNSIAWLSHL